MLMMIYQNNKETEDKWCVYRHTSPSGKIYIGITSLNPYYRWNNGKGYFNSKKSLIKSCIIKYGWDNIKHEILFSNLSEDKAKKLEINLIRHYKNLGISLNLTDGGEGLKGLTPWNKNKKVPYEQSNKRKGIPLSEEHKLKLRKHHGGNSGWMKGKKLPEHVKALLSKINTGRKRTIEEKLKISLNSAAKICIYELNNNGNIINKFNSIKEASVTYGIDLSHLSKCCKRNIVCGGHIFVYPNLGVDYTSINIIKHKRGFHFIFCNYEDRT